MNRQPPNVTGKQQVALILLSTFVALLMAELFIRTYDAFRGSGFFSDRRSEIVRARRDVRPFRMIGVDHYRDVDGVRYISSRHGELYPLEKPENTIRIVVFGGSTTENIRAFKESKVHYPLVVQEALRKRFETERIEVINVANAAYSSAHSLILFELDVISWKPDLVIISHNINDLLVAYFPNFSLDYSNKYNHRAYANNSVDNFTFTNLLFQHSQLYWVVKDRLKKAFGRYSSSALRRTSMGHSLDDVVRDTFARNLHSFVILAEANGIQVLLATQPLHSSEELFGRHMAYKSYNDTVIYPLHEEFVSHHKLLNSIVRDVATENGTWFIDHSPLMNDRDDFFDDFVHYTVAGVQALGGNYARFLTERLSDGGFHRGEPPRDSRRLQSLRGLGHEQIYEVFPGSSGAGGADGFRAPR